MTRLLFAFAGLPLKDCSHVHPSTCLFCFPPQSLQLAANELPVRKASKVLKLRNFK